VGVRRSIRVPVMEKGINSRSEFSIEARPVILVVDDQPQNRTLLEAFLVPWGYEIVMASSGGEALGELSAHTIDLVLMDVVMPGMDGFEATRRIRQDPRHRLLPIVLVTALRETQDRVMGIQAGCDGFISKPVDKEELFAKVESLLRIKSLHDEVDAAREYAESIINTTHEPLIILDQDLRVVSANRSFYEVFQVKPVETVGQLIGDLGNRQWDIPELRKLLEAILPQKTTFDNYEVEHDFAVIGKRFMLLNARQIRRMLGKEPAILVAIQDITERKRAEQELSKAAEERERLVNELQHALDNIRTLQGLIPICANCKKIRDDKGFWNQVEAYISEHTDATFSHGICPDCGKKLYGDLYTNAVEKTQKKDAR
jgi:PAS domain S-box-containing protein